MDYYIVKNGIIKQNGGNKCSENKLKKAMMNGGRIVYDMYDDDILFLPKNGKTIKPSVIWGKVINVRPKEIEKASVAEIAKVIVKKFSKEQKAELKKRGEELTEKVAKKYDILSTKEVKDILNELEKIDRDSTLVKMKNSKEYNEFIELLGDYFINNIQKSTTTDNYRLKLNIDVIKAKKDTEKIRDLYKKNILPRKFTKKIFIPQEISIEYQEARPRSDSFGTIADLVEADLRKKYKDFPEKIAEIDEKSVKSKRMQERLALLQEFDTLKEEDYYDLTNIILKLKESIDDGSTKENKELIKDIFNLLKFDNYADRWDDTDYIVEVLTKMKILRENLSPKQKEIVDKIMSRNEFQMYLAIIEDLNNNKDKFPEKKDLIEQIYNILQNATNENFIDENWVIMVRSGIDQLQQEPKEEVYEINEEEYNKYKKLKDSIVKGFPEFSRKNENFKNFKKAFEEFSAYYLSNTQSKPKSQELISIIRKEFSNIEDTVKLLKSGCEQELEKRGCILESISAGEGTYGTVYNAKCQNKPYVMKIQIFADTENIRGITVEHVFNNEVKYFKIFQNNPLKLYTVKYYDSWTCNGRDGNQTGYIQLEKMDGDVGELVKNNVFTNIEFKKIINIIENFHKLRFIHFDSKPNNYLYKKSGILRTTYNIVSSDFGLTGYIKKDYITENMFNILSMYDYYLFLYELRRFYYFKDKVEIDTDKGLPNNFDILLNKPFKESIMQIISMFIENAKNFNLEEFQSNPYYIVIIGLKISKFGYLMQYYSFIYKVNSIYNNNQEIREKYFNTVKEINNQFKNYIYFNEPPKSSDEEITNINKIIEKFKIYKETITYYSKNIKSICKTIDKTCIINDKYNDCGKTLDDIIGDKTSTEEVKREIDIVNSRILELKEATDFEKNRLTGEVIKLYPRTQTTRAEWFKNQTCEELNKLIERKKVKRETGLEDALEDAIAQIEEIFNNTEREIDPEDINEFNNNKNNLPKLTKLIITFENKYPPRKVVKVPPQSGGKNKKIETYYF